MSGTPTGTVTFYDGGMPLQTVALTGGVASFTVSGWSVGDHYLSAVYNGDSVFYYSWDSFTETITSA